MNTKHTIINGDSRRMSELEARSVHLLKEQLGEVDNSINL